MGPTWIVGRFGNTDVRLHATFPVLLSWFVAVAVARGHTLASTGAALALLTAARFCGR